MNYRAVLFDFDYTLGDATRAIVAGFQYAFQAMGLEPPEQEAVRPTIGMLLEDAFTHLTGESGPERRAEFRRLFLEKADPLEVSELTVLFPGAVELLTALRGAGIAAGVVSTKNERTLRRILEARGMLPLVQVIVGGDQVARPKPDPEGVHAALAVLGLTREAVLYCGDTVIDAETARRVGCDFSAVLNGTTPEEAFAPYPKVHVAPDLIELRAWLGL